MFVITKKKSTALSQESTKFDKWLEIISDEKVFCSHYLVLWTLNYVHVISRSLITFA